MNHQIKIDKRKQIFGLILSLIMMTGVVLFWLDPSLMGNHPFKDEAIIAISLTLFIIFAALFIFLLYKIKTKQFGLIINDEGIKEQVSAFGVGVVRWEEMTGFGIKKQVGIPFIVIYLRDVDEFIDRFSGLKKATIKKNAESFGTPVAVSTVMLKMKLSELKSLFTEVGAPHGLKFEGE